MIYRLLYFASLADRAGCAEEAVESNATDAISLYEEVRMRHGLEMKRERLRVAINGRFVDWSHGIENGDEIAFLPPVSGG
ncbi:MoaD/ThiS family protein [Dokdonella sp.]|uniref:MoaD/ThiS family protein n=1 Tax=Dokdonella sp. TaxID=2291710 RepID=UPI003C610CA6